MEKVNSLKGVIQHIDPQEEVPFNSEKDLGRLTLVAKLFCRELRRCSNLYPPTIYRGSTDTQLKTEIPVKVRLISFP